MKGDGAGGRALQPVPETAGFRVEKPGEQDFPADP